MHTGQLMTSDECMCLANITRLFYIHIFSAVFSHSTISSVNFPFLCSMLGLKRIEMCLVIFSGRLNGTCSSGVRRVLCANTRMNMYIKMFVCTLCKLNANLFCYACGSSRRTIIYIYYE